MMTIMHMYAKRGDDITTRRLGEAPFTQVQAKEDAHPVPSCSYSCRAGVHEHRSIVLMKVKAAQEERPAAQTGVDEVLVGQYRLCGLPYRIYDGAMHRWVYAEWHRVMQCISTTESLRVCDFAEEIESKGRSDSGVTEAMSIAKWKSHK